MITHLKLKNFRSHPDSELKLGPINLLVGPVGAGKSNLLKALVFVQNSVHRELGELFPPGMGEFRWVRSRWAGETDPIGFELELGELAGYPDTSFRYNLEIGDAPGGLYVVKETLQKKTGEAPWQWVFQRGSKGGPTGEFGVVDPYGPSLLYRARRINNSTSPNVHLARAVAGELSSVGYYHLEVAALKSLGSGQPADRITYYGGRLPDFLSYVKSTPEHDDAYRAIHAGLVELLPDVDSILVTQVGPDSQGLSLSYKGHNGYITARDLSDGTLLTLGLLALAYGPKPPRLLCIEEPETGLHPRRLRWVFDHLMGLAYPEAGKTATQVILTSHSPDLVDCFSDMPGAVNVVDYVSDPAGFRKSRVTALPDILAKLQQDRDHVENLGQTWAAGLFESLLPCRSSWAFTSRAGTTSSSDPSWHRWSDCKSAT